MTITRSRRVWTAFAAVALLAVAGGCSSSDESAREPAMTEGPAVETGPEAAAATGPEAGIPPQEAPDLEALRRAQEQRAATLAATYLDQGKRFLDEGRLQEARRSFANALEVAPSNQEAQRLFDQVASLLGEPPRGPQSIARDLRDTELARRQQAAFEARHRMQLGRELYARGEYARAVEEYEKALLIVTTNPTIEAEVSPGAVRTELQSARDARDQAARSAEAERLREIERINAEREETERRRLSQRLDRLWEQSLELFEQERFRECEELCAQIQEIDFNHPHARKLQEAARRARHDAADAHNINEYREKWGRMLEEMKLVAMPQSDDVVFPGRKEWDKISSRGPTQISAGAVQVSEEDEEVRRRLEGTILTRIDWTEKPLDEAIAFIRNNTATNIVVKRVVDEAMPPEDRILNLDLTSPINAYQALSLAVEQLKLRFIIEDGLVKITTPEDLRSRKAVEFYNVRDLTAKLSSFPGIEINLNPSGFGAGIGGFDEAAEEDEENKFVEADRLIEIIRQSVDPTSWDEDPTNTIQDNNGTLIVKQTAENQRRIARLLADLRKSTGVQVRIESRFISVENNFLQDIGVDFRGLGNNSGGIGLPGRGTPVVFDDFGVPGTSLPIGNSNDTGVFYSNGGNGDFRARNENLFDVALGNPDVLTGSGGLSLQFTYLDDTELEAILRAVQKYERVNTVTAPNITVYNTQRANLQVTNHVAYVKDFDVEIAQAAVIADPIIDVVKEGVILDVRPIVSNDRRFVTLELRPTVATLVRPLRQFSTTLAVGTAVTFEVPELRKESLKTTVVMPDGGTLLLGGLKFYEEQDIDSGIPVLKDIPILSFIFSRKGKYTNLRDLIVLLKVKIVILEELEPGIGVGR